MNNQTAGGKEPYKFGYVSLTGLPNAGKSTILNRFIGQKIAIETNKAQTTRRRINGIFTNDKAQIVFIDTPGLHKPFDKLGELLVNSAKSAVPDADIILFAADVSAPAGKGCRWIAENILKNIKKPVILVLNKADLLKSDDEYEKNLLTYKQLFDKDYPAVKISAKTGLNFDELEKIVIKYLPEGEKVYNEDEITDETMRSIARELIREKILIHTRDEVPHSTAVIIEKYEELNDIDKIKAAIIVEHDSQKGIIIGKKGSMLKIIGTEARREIEETAGKKVFLELQVKVIKNWRKKSKDLEKMC